jgi:hypothetical protein
MSYPGAGLKLPHWVVPSAMDAKQLHDLGQQLRITRLAVHAMPGSAAPDEHLRVAGVDAKAIEAAVRALAGDRAVLR